jgi:hypothetical protein
MPRLTFRWPHRVWLPSNLPSLQHPRGPKTTYGSNRARARTGPTRPYDAPRDQANPHWTTNCAGNAERRLTHASCDPPLPLYHPLRSDLLLGDVLGALLNARSRRRVPYCPAKAALPRRRTDASQHASSELHLSVSVEGLTLGLAGAGGAPRPPGL